MRPPDVVVVMDIGESTRPLGPKVAVVVAAEEVDIIDGALVILARPLLLLPLPALVSLADGVASSDVSPLAKGALALLNRPLISA